MALWPISDETTFEIMLDFYDAAFQTGNAPQAPADTQLDWLVRLRKERGLLPAVRLAGAFIMASQGKPVRLLCDRLALLALLKLALAKCQQNCQQPAVKEPG